MGLPRRPWGEGTEVAMERRAGGETCPRAGWGLGEGGTPAGQGRVAGEGATLHGEGVPRPGTGAWCVWGTEVEFGIVFGARWKVRLEGRGVSSWGRGLNEGDDLGLA